MLNKHLRLPATWSLPLLTPPVCLPALIPAQLGLVIATALAGVHVFLGALLLFVNARRVSRADSQPREGIMGLGFRVFHPWMIWLA